MLTLIFSIVLLLGWSYTRATTDNPESWKQEILLFLFWPFFLALWYYSKMGKLMSPRQRTLAKVAKIANNLTVGLLFLLLASGVYYERGGPYGGDLCLHVFRSMGASLLVWACSVAILMALQCFSKRD